MGLLAGLTDAARGAVATWAKSWNEASEPHVISYEGPSMVTRQMYGREFTLDYDSIMRRSPEALYREQPNLRAVVSFLARNVAQLGLHVFDRVDDTDRQRMTSGPAYLLLRHPNDQQTQYELINALMAELALNDIAYWYVSKAVSREAGWQIEPLLGVTRRYDAGGTLEAYEVVRGGKRIRIAVDEVLVFHGWNPRYADDGLSPVSALRTVLAEQLAAVAYRQQRWDKGARVGTYLYRPPNAPVWSIDAQERFSSEWRDKWGRNGPDAGGEPLLQDGMELKRVGFSAKEDDYIEASKLALTTVASVYHVNPVMVGLLDNANYSNVREFRKMLYGDTLGPWLAMIEARITNFLLPMIGASVDTYVEFNVAAKLAGSFEEQASVMSTMVGRPVMTANEGRGKFNLPRIEGDPSADQLITPLNVTVGGQASPQTPVAVTDAELQASGPYDWRKSLSGKSRPVLVRSKSKATDDEHDKLKATLTRFFDRQARSVLSALGGGKSKSGGDWWDGERWNAELSSDLFTTATAVSTRVGEATWDGYDTKRTEAYLRKLAAIRAENINATTQEQLSAAVDAPDDDEEAPTPTAVFDDAKGLRLPIITTTVLTAVTAFGAVEAGHQAAYSGHSETTKTWIVTSPKPRPEHAKMNGETVAIDEKFSNGADWPGDPVLGADGVAGCMCDVAITIS